MVLSSGNIIDRLHSTFVATYSLVAINIAVFIIVNIVRFIFSGVSQGDLAEVFGGSASILVIGQLQIWRLVTSTFLHIEWWHILMNMIALISFGKFIEMFYSSKKLFIVYVLAGIGGSALTLLDNNAITLGASGAIFGLMGLIVGNLIKPGTYSPGLPVNLNSVLYPALIWLLFSLVVGGISFLGHLGGFLTGILLGLIIKTANDFEFSTLKNNIINVLFIGCVAFVTLSLISLLINIFF